MVIGRLFPSEENTKQEISLNAKSFQTTAAATIPVAMTGGVFRHSARVREVFYNELRQLDPRVEINPDVVDPVEGALRMARRGSSMGAAT